MYRSTLWSFSVDKSRAYVPNVRSFEREMLYNLTLAASIRAQGAVVVVSGAIVWVGVVIAALCGCCACPVLCLVLQMRRRKAEKKAQESVAWSRQLEEIMTQARNAAEKDTRRIMRQSQEEYAAAALDERGSGDLRESSVNRGSSRFSTLSTAGRGSEAVRLDEVSSYSAGGLQEHSMVRVSRC